MKACKSFTPIKGPPCNDNMILLRETFFNKFLSIRFFSTDSGCVSGVVLSNDAYLQSHLITLERMLTPVSA